MILYNNIIIIMGTGTDLAIILILSANPTDPTSSLLNDLFSFSHACFVGITLFIKKVYQLFINRLLYNYNYLDNYHFGHRF